MKILMFNLNLQKALLLSALAVPLTSACQTTGNTNPRGLDEGDVAEAQTIVATGCVVGRGANMNKINPDNVTVFGIDKGKNGWVRVDSRVLGRIRMRRSNVYYSLELDELYCGSSSWNSSGYNSNQIFRTSRQPVSHRQPTLPKEIKDKMHLGEPLTDAEKKVLADFYNKNR